MKYVGSPIQDQCYYRMKNNYYVSLATGDPNKMQPT